MNQKNGGEHVGYEAAHPITYVGPEPVEPDPSGWKPVALWLGVGIVFSLLAAVWAAKF